MKKGRYYVEGKVLVQIYSCILLPWFLYSVEQYKKSKIRHFLLNFDTILDCVNNVSSYISFNGYNASNVTKFIYISRILKPYRTLYHKLYESCIVN